ncbi:MAG: hypothetical protein V4793_44085 [Paraburkholderia tropica]|uniref:hypothetical protein n=1 Tax=Paraburkholderia tropica TaxID=92647 RepID=UPI003100C85F
MTETAAITSPDEDTLYERVRLLIFSAPLPIRRLEADVADIGRFTTADARLPHLRLAEAMPPLVQASEAIVRAIIRTYGAKLLRNGNANARLRALITVGPVRFAQAALMLGPDASIPERCRPLVDEFNGIFEHFPESGYSQARRLLFDIGIPVERNAIRTLWQSAANVRGSGPRQAMS